MRKLLLLALPLAGCATISTQPFQNGMNRLIGHPVQTAFDRLGYPDRKEAIEGRTVYYWGTSEDACSFKIVTDSGTVKQWDGYGSPSGCSVYLKGLR